MGKAMPPVNLCNAEMMAQVKWADVEKSRKLLGGVLILPITVSKATPLVIHAIAAWKNVAMLVAKTGEENAMTRNSQG